MHRGLTVADGAQMRELLREGAVFRGCSFDGADLGGLYAEELVFQDCSLRGTNLSDLACEGLYACRLQPGGGLPGEGGHPRGRAFAQQLPIGKLQGRQAQHVPAGGV